MAGDENKGNDQPGMYYKFSERKWNVWQFPIWLCITFSLDWMLAACPRTSLRLLGFLWNWNKPVYMALCWVFWYQWAKHKILITLLYSIFSEVTVITCIVFASANVNLRTKQRLLCNKIYSSFTRKECFYSRPRDLTGLSLLLVF